MSVAVPEVLGSEFGYQGLVMLIASSSAYLYVRVTGGVLRMTILESRSEVRCYSSSLSGWPAKKKQES